MICAIMQPTYIPWLGYFNMINKSDVFVFLDNVQIEKRSWQVRNRIKGFNGEIMLTIPTGSGSRALICEADIDNTQKWQDRHLNTIYHNYCKAYAFTEVFPIINEIYSVTYNKLSEFNINLIKIICKYIGITKEFILSSELGITGIKDELLVNVCREIGADSYLSARGSSVYINRDKLGGLFSENNINLFYFDYDHPVYPQLFGEFIPYMGVYDLLLNVGLENARNIIKSGDKPNLHYLDI